ncbi:MAG: YncE family protein [Acidobacteria bacterium]|nr:YncE family protein [Acidobacteriota bacterium]
MAETVCKQSSGVSRMGWLSKGKFVPLAMVCCLAAVNWPPLGAPLPRLDLAGSIKSGKGPYGLQVSHDGQRLFVANFASDEVGVLDLDDPQGKMELFYAGPEPIDLALSPLGDRLFVVNFRAGLVSVVTTQDLRMSDNVKVGGQPVAVTVSGSGDRVFVANWGRTRIGQLDVIDGNSHELLRSVRVGVRPLAVAAGPNGDFVYVANGGSNSITRVALSNYETTEAPCIENPNGLALTPDGKWLYVAGANGSEVAVMDAGTLKEARRIAVGTAPFGIAVHPRGWIITADRKSGTVSVFDPGLSTVAQVKVGETPNDVAISADGRTVYVSVEKDNKIAVVKLQ